MGARRIRITQRQHDQAASRIENGELKRSERQRRHARLLELLKKGKLPYTPTVMSWLSVALDKPSSRITQEDVNAVLAGQ